MAKSPKRTRRNDTPKMPRAAKTLTIYIRASADTVAWLRKIAIDRGHPHTFASVTNEMLELARVAHTAAQPTVDDVSNPRG